MFVVNKLSNFVTVCRNIFTNFLNDCNNMGFDYPNFNNLTDMAFLTPLSPSPSPASSSPASSPFSASNATAYFVSSSFGVIVCTSYNRTSFRNCSSRPSEKFPRAVSISPANRVLVSCFNASLAQVVIRDPVSWNTLGSYRKNLTWPRNVAFYRDRAYLMDTGIGQTGGRQIIVRTWHILVCNFFK